MDLKSAATVIVLEAINTAQNKYFVAGCVTGGSIVYHLLSQNQHVAYTSNIEQKNEATGLKLGKLDIRRQCQIIKGGPTDHAGEVTYVLNPQFNLDHTIFGSISSSVLRYFQSAKLGVKLYWGENIIERTVNAFQNVPRAPNYDKPLLDFITNDCNFAMVSWQYHFMSH